MNYFTEISRREITWSTKVKLDKEYDTNVFDSGNFMHLKKKKIIGNIFKVLFLNSKVEIDVGQINLWNWKDLPLKVIGVGGINVIIDNWYKTLDDLATECLISRDGAVNIANVSKYLVPISCAILNCVKYDKDADIAFFHFDTFHPLKSEVNPDNWEHLLRRRRSTRSWILSRQEKPSFRGSQELGREHISQGAAKIQFLAGNA